jgi:cyclase
VEVHEIQPHVTAVIPKATVISKVGCNVGLIHTNEGVVLIDTSISKNRTRLILDTAGVQIVDVCLAIYTHLHSDHINGNDLFDCPVLCHFKAKRRMEKMCAKSGRSVITFDNEHKVNVGNIQLHLIHVGGHTPESIVIWMPGEKILFSGDLIFSGRAPFLASVTNYHGLIKSLKWSLSLGAEVIVPGHGSLCDNLEIISQRNYLEKTWEIIKGHMEKGHSPATIRKDPDLPHVAGLNFERNLEWIYKQLSKRAGR